MRTIRKNLIIIGLMVLIGLTVQAKTVNALYSPRISQQVSVIRQHILSSQAVNDTGTVLEAVESIIAYNKDKRERGLETGISGDARVAQELVFKTTFWPLIQFPFDSLFMVFNFNVWKGEWISNCLRDEIWGLESLRDIVGQEMVKAYLMRDIIHGNLLKKDYAYLVAQIDLLRRFGSKPTAEILAEDKNGKIVKLSSGEYFFGIHPNETNGLNYYSRAYFQSDKTSCPDGEFEQVFQNVANAAKSLSTMTNPATSIEWGSIKQMAQANARSRARQWIAANQITLTLGGEEGGRTNSIVKGRGWEGFVGNLKTQWQAMKTLIGPVTPFFSRSFYKPGEGLISDTKVECVIYDAEDLIFRNCTTDQAEQYRECKKNKEKAEEKGIPCSRYRTIDEATSMSNKLSEQVKLIQEHGETEEEVKTAFVYSINLDSVSEQTIYEIDYILFLMNGTIKRGYEGMDEKAGAGIPSLTEEVKVLSKRHCAN